MVPSIILPGEKRKRKLCVLATIEKWIPHRCWFKPYGCYLNLACHKSSIYHSVCSPSHFICELVQRIAVVQTTMCHYSRNQVSPKLCKGPSSAESFILRAGSPKSFWTLISGNPVPDELLLSSHIPDTLGKQRQGGEAEVQMGGSLGLDLSLCLEMGSIPLAIQSPVHEPADIHTHIHPGSIQHVHSSSLFLTYVQRKTHVFVYLFVYLINRPNIYLLYSCLRDVQCFYRNTRPRDTSQSRRDEI